MNNKNKENNNIEIDDFNNEEVSEKSDDIKKEEIEITDEIEGENLLENIKSEDEEIILLEEKEAMVLSEKEPKKKKLNKGVQIKYGTIALITVVIVTALVVILNLFSTELWEKYPISTDVTAEGIYELDEKTAEFLASLDKEVTVTILAEEEFFSQVNSGDAEGSLPKINNMIKRYTQKSKNITLEYVNILEDPTISNKYPELNLSYGNILITLGDRVKSLTLDDLLVIETDYQTGNQYLVGYKAEQTLTLAILSVITDDLNKAVVLTGFDSFMEPTGISSLLSTNNYSIEEVSIMTQEIPKDTDVVILGAPTRDLTKDEVKKIDDFLDNDGNLDRTLYYLPYYTQDSDTPNIDGLLADWGIKVAHDYVYELDENRLVKMNPPYLSFLTGYKDSSFSAGLEEKPYIVSIAFPIETLFETSGNRGTSVLLETSDKSYLRPMDAEDDFAYDGKGDKGPFNIIVVGEKSIGGSAIKSSRVIVNSSVSSSSQNFMEGKIFGNAEHTMNLFNKFHPNEYDFVVTPKNINDYSLPITESSIRFFGSLFLIILPLSVLIIGLVIWFRRQKK